MVHTFSDSMKKLPEQLEMLYILYDLGGGHTGIYPREKSLSCKLKVCEFYFI